MAATAWENDLARNRGLERRPANSSYRVRGERIDKHCRAELRVIQASRGAAVKEHGGGGGREFPLGLASRFRLIGFAPGAVPV
jgi:hypothetical protein